MNSVWFKKWVSEFISRRLYSRDTFVALPQYTLVKRKAVLHASTTVNNCLLLIPHFFPFLMGKLTFLIDILTFLARSAHKYKKIPSRVVAEALIVVVVKKEI